jgi:hypothetical protein
LLVTGQVALSLVSAGEIWFVMKTKNTAAKSTSVQCLAVNIGARYVEADIRNISLNIIRIFTMVGF